MGQTSNRWRLALPTTTQSTKGNYPRWQREEMQFSPGEQNFQSFPRGFFNNVCGQCHGSISGQQVQVAVDPDVLTQASIVDARTTAATSVGLTASARTTTFVGPPATP